MSYDMEFLVPPSRRETGSFAQKGKIKRFAQLSPWVNLRRPFVRKSPRRKWPRRYAPSHPRRFRPTPILCHSGFVSMISKKRTLGRGKETEAINALRNYCAVHNLVFQA